MDLSLEPSNELLKYMNNGGERLKTIRSFRMFKNMTPPPHTHTHTVGSKSHKYDMCIWFRKYDNLEK